MLRKMLCLALILALTFLPARAHTRDEVRAAHRALPGLDGDALYAAGPAARAPYVAGALADSAKADALAYLNFIRWLAGLDPVSERADYDDACQHGAALLAALDYVDHDAPRPADMDADFYALAHAGTASSNIARLSWFRPSVLRDGVEYFLRDDGEANLSELGHRRWALNPLMSATGFGLAESDTGSSYVFMYAHDLGRADARWSEVCWPAEGAFPATLMHADLAWSVTLNPGIYDLAASTPVVTLSETSGGLRFRFLPATGGGDGYCAVNREGYGPGPCLIFRPDFSGADFTDYRQNQHWTVRVEGLVDRSGAARTLEYAVDMISLNVEDAASVELSQLEAALAPGDMLALSARVLPDFADDLSVSWSSSDPAVAIVDDHGRVTAIAPGQCEVVARTANGRQDACAVTVTEP